MTTCKARPWAGLILITAALAAGCNSSLPFFLMLGLDPKHDPKFKIASSDKDKEVKILVLTSLGNIETREEFVRFDRELGSHVNNFLQKGFKGNKEKVALVSTTKVEEYKNNHPNWKSLSAAEIGEHFKADYVVELEILALSLYEPGSGNQLYRGKAEISISAFDVHSGDEEPKYKEHYVCEYPKTRGPIPVGDTSKLSFRLGFINHMAEQISWRFTAHSIDDDFRMEQ